jgi:hypothetical protein
VRHRCLPLYISGDLYSQLEQAGRAEERDPMQQARWLIKRALEAEMSAEPTQTAREDAAVA